MGVSKQVLLDSSSAILLEKTDLLGRLLDSYDVALTRAVFRELTDNNYPSSTLFRQKYSQSLIQIISPGDTIKDFESDELMALNLGERETILQYLSGNGDFIMLDDGKAARYCARQQLPFINALLFPIILRISGSLSEQESDQKVAEIISIGRYSGRIVQMALGMKKEALRSFLP